MDEREVVDIHSARVRRAGKDLTLIAYGGTLGKALSAAEQLAGEGISAEVLDLRVLRPLDTEAIVASVSRTRRAIVVDEMWRTGSFAGEISALQRITTLRFRVAQPLAISDANTDGMADLVDVAVLRRCADTPMVAS